MHAPGHGCDGGRVEKNNNPSRRRTANFPAGYLAVVPEEGSDRAQVGVQNDLLNVRIQRNFSFDSSGSGALT